MTPITAELTELDAPERIAEQLGDQPLDVLVNNAAYEVYHRLHEFSAEEFEQILRVDLVQPLMLSKALLPNLRRGEEATVIHVTSIHDTVPVANNGAYAAAKAALLMATRTAAIELAPYGIRVNAFAPGAIETDMNREVIEQVGRGKV